MTAPEQYIEITGPPLAACAGANADGTDPDNPNMPPHPFHAGRADRRCKRCGLAHGDAHDMDLTEVGMSDCEFGCKIWRRGCCGEELVLHSATYGCRGSAA